MSIKQSIALLLLFFGVSFSAFANLVQVKDVAYGSGLSGCPVSIGQVMDVSYLFECPVGKKDPSGRHTITRTSTSGSWMSYHYGSSSRKQWVNYAAADSCPDGTEVNPETGLCEAPPSYCELPSTIQAIEAARNQCESRGGTFNYTCSDEEQTWEPDCELPPEEKCKDFEGASGDVAWDSKIWGNSSPSSYLCSSIGGGCGAAIDRSSSWCGESGWCYASYTVIGPACNVPEGPSFCSDPECNNFKDPNPDEKPDTDPDHKPDDPTGGDIEDPSVLPDSDSGGIVNPDEPEPEPDVEEPEITPETDKAVVDAVTGMNKDINGSLNALNKDLNKGNADIQNELRTLNASLITNTQAIQKQQINDNDIYRKTKSLIQQANADITTSVNKNTNAINALGDDVESIAGSMDGIAEDISGISETLDGIANTDTSGSGWGGTCIADDSCTGFYDSGYPDGIEGVVSGHMSDIKDTVLDGFINTFGELDLSNAQAPSFCMNVLTFGEYCFTDYIDFDWMFGFIRFVMIFSAIAQSRKIIFGG